MPAPSELRLSLAAISLRAAAVLSVLSHLTAPDEIEAALRGTLPDLIETFGLAAGALAADWYDDYRAEHGVTGRFRAAPVAIGDRGAAQLATWASHRSIQDSDWLQLSQGGLQRRVANIGRETVMQASVADPQARGWRREASGNGCNFCSRLNALAATRGGVYTEGSARFLCHDNCKCSAAPVFVGASDR